MVFRQCGLEELVELEMFAEKMRVPGQGKSIVNPDIIIVPGLAFDESAIDWPRRRFLRCLSSEFSRPKIGICKQLQLVDELPVEDHDVKVDFVVTDQQIIEVTSHKEDI